MICSIYRLVHNMTQRHYNAMYCNSYCECLVTDTLLLVARIEFYSYIKQISVLNLKQIGCSLQVAFHLRC